MRSSTYSLSFHHVVHLELDIFDSSMLPEFCYIDAGAKRSTTVHDFQNCVSDDKRTILPSQRRRQSGILEKYQSPPNGCYALLGHPI